MIQSLTLASIGPTVYNIYLLIEGTEKASLGVLLFHYCIIAIYL